MLFEHLSSLYLAGSIPWLPNLSSSKVSSSTTSNDEASNIHFNWDDIKPSEKLDYHDCFDTFQCARLQVPMDWTNLTDPRTVEIAVIRLPATVPITSPNYGGPVIINPGGPGGSGVHLALLEAKDIQTIVSAGPDASNDTARHFDILSFDPRGVNNTTPYFNCFPNHIEMANFLLDGDAIGTLGSSDAAFGIHWARYRGLGAACAQQALESGIGEYVTTASVARDIIEVVERHGEWREEETKRLLSVRSVLRPRGVQIPILDQDDSETLKRVKYRPGEEMVQYWGFSYGTILGATLAAMYPERMHRIALDGVSDSFDYMEGGWRSDLADTDMQIIKFGDYCWLGGAEHCAMYHEDGPAVIVSNFMAVMDDIKKNPIMVPATDEHAAGVATYTDLKQYLFSSLYTPLKSYPNLARTMKELSNGNGTALLARKRGKVQQISEGLTDECTRDGPHSSACFRDHKKQDTGTNNGLSIYCTDAEDQTKVTKDEYWQYAEEIIGQSVLMGDTWAAIMLPCTNWNIRPKWRYEGNFTATTAHPILFVSNTADNVTPLRNAIRMSKGFPGSVVLQQNTEGHCSASGVSFCTARAIREYFQSGALPAKKTLCEPDVLPLSGVSEEEKPKLPEGETDEEMWRAMLHFAVGR